MNYIMPKITANGTGYDAIKNEFGKFEKAELQLLINEYTYIDMPRAYDIYIKEICQFIEKYPEFNELTIHTPIGEYCIESLFLRDSTFILWTTKLFVKIAQKYDKKINILYHTLSNYKMFIYDWEKYFTPVIDILENTNVYIIFENNILNKEKERCFPLELAKHYDNNHIKVCIDICHIQCKANIYHENLSDYIKHYILKDCLKYIYQIHFSATLNNDGYRDKSTHGRVHPDFESALKDCNILNSFGINNVYWVTEISEEDYVNRNDQIQEIKYLQKILSEK